MCVQQNNGLSLPLKSIKIFVSLMDSKPQLPVVVLGVTEPKCECRLITFHIPFYTIASPERSIIFCSFRFFLSSKSKHVEDCDWI